MGRVTRVALMTEKWPEVMQFFKVALRQEINQRLGVLLDEYVMTHIDIQFVLGVSDERFILAAPRFKLVVDKLARRKKGLNFWISGLKTMSPCSGMLSPNPPKGATIYPRMMRTKDTCAAMAL